MGWRRFFKQPALLPCPGCVGLAFEEEIAPIKTRTLAGETPNSKNRRRLCCDPANRKRDVAVKAGRNYASSWWAAHRLKIHINIAAHSRRYVVRICTREQTRRRLGISPRYREIRDAFGRR